MPQDQIEGKAESPDPETQTRPPEMERFRASVQVCCELPFANANAFYSQQLCVIYAKVYIKRKPNNSDTLG